MEPGARLVGTGAWVALLHLSTSQRHNGHLMVLSRDRPRSLSDPTIVVPLIRTNKISVEGASRLGRSLLLAGACARRRLRASPLDKLTIPRP